MSTCSMTKATVFRYMSTPLFTLSCFGSMDLCNSICASSLSGHSVTGTTIPSDLGKLSPMLSKSIP